MKNTKKSTAIIISIFFSISVLAFLSSRLFFHFFIEKQQLNNSITAFCKEALGKAVKYEKLEINSFGNIVLSKFDLSAGPDFNDNLSLIHADTVIFNVNILSLLQGKVSLNGISITDGNILIHKSFGESHKTTFYNLFIPKNLSLVKAPDNNSAFTLTLRKCNVTFEEKFKDAKVKLNIKDLGGKLNWYDDFYTLQASGIIYPKNASNLKKGTLDIKSRVPFTKKEKTILQFELENFDVSYVNRYLKEFGISNNIFSGGISINYNQTIENDKIESEGKISTISLNVAGAGKDNYNIISNANLDIDFSGSTDYNFDQFIVNNLTAINNDMRINAKASLKKKTKQLTLKCESNKINLHDLWQNFTPLKDSSYSGLMKFNLDWDIDLEKGTVKKFASNLEINDFKFNSLIESADKKIITNGKLLLKSDQNKIIMDGGYSVFDSDFKVHLDTDILKYWPIKTNTNINFKSKRLESRILVSVISNTIDNIMDAAYRDKKTGYHESSFLEKDICKLIANNNLTLRVHADELVAGEKTKFKNLNLEIENKNGFIRSTDFNLDGYGGDYRFELNGYFNTAHPFIKIRGGAGKVALPLFKSTADSTDSGIFNLDFDYELSAFRMAQILENSKGNVFLSVKKGVLNSPILISALVEFCKKNNLSIPVNQKITLNSVDVTLAQIGEHFIFRNFRIDAKNLNLNGYGKYLYSKGIEIPVSFSYLTNEGKIKNVPIKIVGRLFDPGIQPRYGKNKKTVSVFHGN